MDTRSIIRKATAGVCMALAMVTALTSCDGMIYEGEGDCSVHYRVSFRYEMNLKWADAFANEVTSVHLYAFDPAGVLVWQRDDTVGEEEARDYSMELELPAGDYQLLAWCGLRNDGVQGESFAVPEAVAGQTRIEDLQCRLNRLYDAAGAYSSDRLYRLFHGRLDVTLPEAPSGGEYEYTMYLTKNTNHVRVILQHLSGQDVDVDDFRFRIEDSNGLMAHHNGLLEDETITYRPWKTQSGEAAVGKEGTRAMINVRGAIADLTVGRMTEGHRRGMVLTVTRRDGTPVARIPVIDYALLAKDYYEEEYGRRMTDQEFLDREDDYVMTFFLDENGEWISSQILIHSWVVVPSEVEIK